MKVFLSYARPERELAKELASHLNQAGYHVWNTEEEILPGDNFAEKIAQALEDSDAMVVLLSPEAVESTWVRAEIDYALGSLNYAGRLVPVVVRPTPDIPWILRTMNALHAGKDRAALGRRIIRQLESAPR
jgi:hypothetical protein